MESKNSERAPILNLDSPDKEDSRRPGEFWMDSMKEGDDPHMDRHPEDHPISGVSFDGKGQSARDFDVSESTQFLVITSHFDSHFQTSVGWFIAGECTCSFQARRLRDRKERELLHAGIRLLHQRRTHV